jgi:Asp-tRNA(Asn)/Glu-tRNA(Gln) amidotransferase B subunit
VFEMIARKILRKFAPVFDDKLTLEEKIKFFFREHIAFLQENPKLPGFILNEVNRNPASVKKLVKNIHFENLWKNLYEQHKKELEKYNVTEAALPQLMVSVAALSVFPFAARGILEGILEKTGHHFDEFIEERKVFAAEFVIKAITKQEKIKVVND